jgi:hypothetical protein
LRSYSTAQTKGVPRLFGSQRGLTVFQTARRHLDVVEVFDACLDKVRIRFRVNRMMDPDPTCHIDSLEDGLDPDPALEPIYRSPSELTIDEFLRHPIMRLDGKEQSMKDIIKFAANVAGSIHLDPKPKREYAIIKAFSNQYGIGGLRLGIYPLGAISRVTLKALQPLLDDIAKQA